MLKKLKLSLYLVITIALTLGLSISFQSLLAAWVAPTANPTASNVKRPVYNASGIDNDPIVNSDLTVNGDFFVGSDTLKVDEATGKVGIGTTDPQNQLHIVGEAEIILEDTGGTGTWIQHRPGNIGAHNWDEGANDSGFSVVDRSTNQYRLTVGNNGNVGIGTIDPSAGLKLDVEGFIGATKYCDENGNNCVAASQISTSTLTGTAGFAPQGTVAAFNLAACPTGWSLADGTDGRPDLRGRMIVGQNTADASFDQIRETGGAKTHTLSVPEMPSHSHVQYYNYNFNGFPLGYGGGGWGMFDTLGFGGANQRVESTGGSAPHNNMSPYTVLIYCVKTNGGTEYDGSSLWTQGAGTNIYKDVGKVGIGTDSPAHKLTIKVSEIDGTKNLYIWGSGVNPEIALGNGTANEHWSIYHDLASDDLRFWKENNNILTITDNGNVGIGLINPTNKLDISGGIRSTGISIAEDFCTPSGKCLSQMTPSAAVPTTCPATSVFWSSSCCGDIPVTSVGGVATAISGGNSCSAQSYNTFSNGTATYSCTTSGWQRTSCSCNGNPC